MRATCDDGTQAVPAAYGLPADADEQRILGHLLALNLDRAEAENAASD